jgi:hypothetical protein
MGSSSRMLLALASVEFVFAASFAVGDVETGASGCMDDRQAVTPAMRQCANPATASSRRRPEWDSAIPGEPGSLRGRSRPRNGRVARVGLPYWHRPDHREGQAPAEPGLLRRPRSTPVRLAAYQSRRTAGRLAARWLGQDQHDYVGPHSRLEASDVQDIHIALAGLDPRREVVFVEINGHGGDQWEFAPRPKCWKAELKREPGSRTADLFIEPSRVETGRSFHVTLRYDDGSTAEAVMMGRTADPQLRMPGQALQGRWLGQRGGDWTGPGPCVGPDGFQDIQLHLTKFSARSTVRAVRIECSSGSRWEYGTNPKLLANAELVRDAKNPTEGDLYFQPDHDTNGERLKVRVLYDNDQQDSVTIVAGQCDPKLRVPRAPLPELIESRAAVEWLGQDDANPERPGDVHVRISKLADARSIDAAVLSGGMRRIWVFGSSDRAPKSTEPEAMPMKLTIGPDGNSADLWFPPDRETGGERYFLRLVSSQKRNVVIGFQGQRCELARRAPLPAADRVAARPGDDLQALVDGNGTVVLSPGNYRLSRPLVLNRPVKLTCDGGATLRFAQPPTDAPWSAAIKIHHGNTTLNGFAVRFEGPIRWNNEISWGPAVIGMTDNRDPDQDRFRPNIVLTHLDLQVPPVETNGKWVEAIRLMRLLRAASGVIANNTLRGGPIEFFEGPWRVVDNDFRGCLPGTASHAVFVGHGTRDLVIRGNRTSSESPSGKTWRFLVLGGYSLGAVIERNTIEQIGARDDDTIPWSNEPEIILTESYRLRYEGRAMAVSADGRVLRVGQPQGEGVRTGDMVSILNGPAAGGWRRVAQVIDPTTLLIDPPLPAGTDVISIGEGFTGVVFQENRIDARGGRRAECLILSGNHFGTRVSKNHFLGGAHAILLGACVTEQPRFWGWSHAPFLGGVIEGNVIEDSEKGAVFGVEHNTQHAKTNFGRTYMTIRVSQNTVRWSQPFLERFAQLKNSEPLAGLIFGFPASDDPNELVVQADANWLDAPPGQRVAPALWIRAANYNSRAIVNRSFALSPREQTSW